jgi:hypothetical protein
MTYKNIMEKLKTVWSWVLQVFQGVQFCFMHYLRMVQCIGDFLFLLLFKETAVLSHQDLEDLELWNSFSYYPSVSTFDFLIGQRCKYLGKDKKFIHGEYLFTIDWAHPEPNILDTEHSEIPDQHKCAHILALDNGNFAAQPNNRILWSMPSFTTSTHWPDYKVTTTEWNVEKGRWQLEDTDNMFYNIDKKE